jgi:hypothetical protein
MEMNHLFIAHADVVRWTWFFKPEIMVQPDVGLWKSPQLTAGHRFLWGEVHLVVDPNLNPLFFESFSRFRHGSGFLSPWC